MSIYLAATNKDLYLPEILATIPSLTKVAPIYLPYSALYPNFLMENEITQALCLLGYPPSWDSPASNLKLYTPPVGAH